MNDISLRAEIKKQLSTAGIESADFEARQIVLEAKDKDEALSFAARRIGGEPLQYIFGKWEFYGMPFYVGKGVLIPRPDTETLVDEALKIVKKDRMRVLDLCSGSGAVAIAIEKNCNCLVTAIEKSDEAYSYLIKNIALNNSNVKPIKGDIFEDFEGEFDLIVSNPPYIKSAVVDTLDELVKKEPRMALDGGEDGLIFYKRIAEYWSTKLKNGGHLACEIGYDQADEVTEIFNNSGLKNIKTVCDLSKNQRVIIGTFTTEPSCIG